MLNIVIVSETSYLELFRGAWNFLCRGKIRRYKKEHQKRRQRTGDILTVRDESVGSKED